MHTIKKIVLAMLLVPGTFAVHAQRDSVAILPKVAHAEPLFIDLIRDLGARKGEKEWNIGLGMADQDRFDEYTALVEYEFAPLNRLGLEVELPFTFYGRNASNRSGEKPGSRLNGLKLAGQYTFLVAEKQQTSLAFGYIHEFAMQPFAAFSSGVFSGHIYSPFFIAAKRWGRNFHTLIYTGPYLVREQAERESSWQHHTSFHYLLPDSKNFIGVELNKTFGPHGFDLTFRPQFRLALAENLLVGIVTGIPLKRDQERFSSFLRLIYEPLRRGRTQGAGGS